MNEEKRIALAECLRLMNECLYDMENVEAICINLVIIKRLKNTIPKVIYRQIETFVKKYIEPLLYDKDYFSFLHLPEFGYFDKDTGNFVIRSEEAFVSMLNLFFEHRERLLRKLDVFASKLLIS